jgi:hypothetical protein
MKKPIVITDLTRMQEGRVCVAGYDSLGQCIRPVLPPPGIHESTLLDRGSPIVFPFAVVEYEFTQPHSQPPHTEDYRYDPASVRLVERLTEEQRRSVLEKSLFDSVSAIFEQPILTDPGHYVMDGRGPRSLGTLQPRRVIKAVYEQSPEGKWKYRLGFEDAGEVVYWLTVTDLAWRYFCDFQGKSGLKPEQIASRLSATLRSSDTFLRIGLARGWDKFPDRCYLQITGIYTFPDYLEGKTFADFLPTKT